MKHQLSILTFFILFLLIGCKHEQKQLIYSINDVAKDGTIGVLLGSSQEDYATKEYPDAKKLHIDMTPELIMALESGACDVIFLCEDEAEAIKKEHTNLDYVKGNYPLNPVGIGFSKNDTILCKQFNIFLKQIRSDGTYDEIKNRWLSNNDSIAVMPEISSKTSDNGNVLRVGTTGTSVPYSYIKDNQNVGFDIEIMRHFAAYLNRPIVFENMNFKGLIPALASGKLDAIANAIMITLERSKEIQFSDEYYTPRSSVLAQKSRIPGKKGYSSIEDLKGKQIGVLTGSTQDIYLSTKHPEIIPYRLENIAEMVQALQIGRCEALLDDDCSVKIFMEKHKDLVILDFESEYITLGVGFSYNQLKLRDDFNAFLDEIKANGIYDEIYHRWIDSPSKATLPQIKTFKDGEPLKVASMFSLMPFDYIQNNTYVGFDVEMMLRFAEKLQRPIIFENINFSSLISSLASGKVDIICAGITITEERSKNVAFSNPYFQTKNTLVILDKNSSKYIATTEGQEREKKNFFSSIKESVYNNLIAERRYMLILRGLKITLYISLFASIFGTIIGAGICYLRMSRRKTLNYIGRGYISIMRGTPILVLLLIMYYVIFARWNINATIVAIITFALNFAAYVSEMFRTSIEGVDRGQTEAGIALGFTPVQTFINIVMPQAIKNVLPVYKGELISLIKMTSIVGYIAVEDLTKASDIIRSRTFDAFFPLILVAAIYFLLAWAFTYLIDLYNRKKFSRS